MTEEHPVPRFWHPDFISDYTQSHPDKQVAVLAWSSDDDIIIQQLTDAIESNADVILSELLPDELPERVLIVEHEYYVEHYVFAPPQFKTEIKPISGEKKDDSKPLLVFNSGTSKQFSIGNHSKETSTLIMKILAKSESVTAFDISGQESGLAKLVDVVDTASRVITILESPQESLAVRMLSARMGKPCVTLNDWAGSPFRYACVGLVPQIGRSSCGKSLRVIISETIFSNDQNSETKLFSEETLALFTSKYSGAALPFSQGSNEYQWFAKDLYAIEQDDAFWREPWLAQRIDVSEPERRETLGRFVRKATHSFLQNIPSNIEKNRRQKELYVILQEDVLNWYVRRFVYKSRIDTWMDEFILCYFSYDNWLEFIKKEIVSWYQGNSSNVEAFSEIGEVILLISARQSDVKIKAEFLNIAEELMTLDQELSRLRSQSQYKLHHFLCKTANNDSLNLTEEFIRQSLISKKNLSAVKQCIQMLPLFVGRNDLGSIEKALASSDLPHLSYERDITIGLINALGVDIDELVYNNDVFQSTLPTLKSDFEFLTEIYSDSNSIDLNYLLLLFKFNHEKAIEICQNENKLQPKIYYTWLLWYFEHEHEAVQIFQNILVHELSDPWDYLRHLANSIVLKQHDAFKDCLTVFNKRYDNYLDPNNPSTKHPYTYLWGMLIFSALNNKEQTLNQYRQFQSQGTSFHSKRKTLGSKLSQFLMI